MILYFETSRESFGMILDNGMKLTDFDHLLGGGDLLIYVNMIEIPIFSILFSNIVNNENICH